MALVRRVERPAEQADPRASPIAPVWHVGAASRLSQGRTWPLPVTT
jgi:hypothetical protein